MALTVKSRLSESPSGELISMVGMRLSAVYVCDAAMEEENTVVVNRPAAG